jgi:hypothetical protein
LPAQQSVDVASKLLTTGSRPPTRLFVQSIGAQVRAASGHVVEAAASLDRVRAEAVRLHLDDEELETRLTLGEIEIKSGKASAGRARLAVLEKDAATKGYALIARKAHAAAR